MKTLLAEHKGTSEEEKMIVTGYVHDSEKYLPNDIFYNIPDVIMFIILTYFHDPEKWDPEKCDKGIIINGDTVTNKQRLYKSVSMTKCVEPDTGIHEWKFKIIHMEYGWQVIGIWKSDNEFGKIYTNGYGYIVNSRAISDPEEHGSRRGQYGAICKDGDIVEMILDTNGTSNFTLSYRVNEKHLGIAYNDVQNTKYKAGITMCHASSKYTFLSYPTLLDTFMGISVGNRFSNMALTGTQLHRTGTFNVFNTDSNAMYIS